MDRSGCSTLRAGLSKAPHVVFSRQRKPARFELADWVNLGLAGVLGLHFKSLEQVVTLK